MSKKRTHKKISVSGQSINYNHFDLKRGKGGHHFTEVTVGATGSLQTTGSTKKSKKRNLNQDTDTICKLVAPPSRLSRRALIELALSKKNIKGDFESYQDAKKAISKEEYRAKREQAMEGMLKGWVCSSDENNFTLPKIEIK
jgi:hypothetical protein